MYRSIVSLGPRGIMIIALSRFNPNTEMMERPSVGVSQIGQNLQLGYFANKPLFVDAVEVPASHRRRAWGTSELGAFSCGTSQNRPVSAKTRTGSAGTTPPLTCARGTTGWHSAITHLGYLNSPKRQCGYHNLNCSFLGWYL